jgi:hypothetical protein
LCHVLLDVISTMYYISIAHALAVHIIKYM